VRSESAAKSASRVSSEYLTMWFSIGGGASLVKRTNKKGRLAPAFAQSPNGESKDSG
jgi:hypothetical protein